MKASANEAWPERTEQITLGTLDLESIGFHPPLADLYERTPLGR